MSLSALSHQCSARGKYSFGSTRRAAILLLFVISSGREKFFSRLPYNAQRGRVSQKLLR
jgi:hypothetical protein